MFTTAAAFIAMQVFPSETYRSYMPPTDPRSSISDDSIAEAVAVCCPQFGIEALKPLQHLCLCQLVRGDDVLACFPTGYGKSMIFHMIPSVCNTLRVICNADCCPSKPIVVVVSPLLSLMRDQVAFLTEHGVTAAMMVLACPKTNRFNVVMSALCLAAPRCYLADLIGGTPFNSVDSAITSLLLLQTKFTASFNG